MEAIELHVDCPMRSREPLKVSEGGVTPLDYALRLKQTSVKIYLCHREAIVISPHVNQRRSGQEQ